MPLSGSGDGHRTLPLQAAGGEVRGVLRFEPRVLLSGVEVLERVESNAMASFAILSQDIPVMSLLFHLMTLILDALRFEPKLSLALFSPELKEVIKGFVEGAEVGGFVTEI